MEEGLTLHDRGVCFQVCLAFACISLCVFYTEQTGTFIIAYKEEEP